MPIQKKHKFYAGLVGAALVAWGIDAMFFESTPGGSPVAAAAPAPPPASISRASAPTATKSDGAGPKWLSDRLRDWERKYPAGLDEVRDVFSAPASWLPPVPTVTPPGRTPEKVAQDFQREHHLSAVVLSPSGGSAVVDGRLLHVGQTVGGCRVVAVSRDCADMAGPEGQQFRIAIGPDDSKSVK